ncbi:MAG: hypothetical protein J6Y80_02865 [Victivallales bacterium]|nr:hypothetical protein [Victivallales bacterium]
MPRAQPHVANQQILQLACFACLLTIDTETPGLLRSRQGREYDPPFLLGIRDGFTLLSVKRGDDAATDLCSSGKDNGDIPLQDCMGSKDTMQGKMFCHHW